MAALYTGPGQNCIAYLSLLVIYVCLREEKISLLRLVLQIFARSMTKLYAKIKGAHAVSLFFLKLGMEMKPTTYCARRLIT